MSRGDFRPYRPAYDPLIVDDMARIATYARPSSLNEAVRLFESKRAVVIGGGTTLGRRPSSSELDVVDLQRLGLGGISIDGDRARIGATVTFDELARHEGIPGHVRDAARRELPSTLRTLATLGGLAAAGTSDSELLALLLVHEAVVSIAAETLSTEEPLEEYLASPSRARIGIVTAVTFRISGRTAVARTARSRADRPIVVAAARVGPDGHHRLALCGVAPTPVLVDNPQYVDPPGDYRGSSEYRAALAEILSARVLEEVS